MVKNIEKRPKKAKKTSFFQKNVLFIKKNLF